MRKFYLPLLALLASCGKNEDCDIVTPNQKIWYLRHYMPL